MIKALIYTDDLEKWLKKICEGLSETKIIKDKNGYVVYNCLFHIVITSFFNEWSRGACFNFTILDKSLSLSLEETIRSCTKESIIDYRCFKIWEEINEGT